MHFKLRVNGKPINEFFRWAKRDDVAKEYAKLNDEEKEVIFGIIEKRSDSQKVPHFKGAVRLKSESYPLYGHYILRPRMGRKVVAGYHSTNYLLGLNIMENGIKLHGGEFVFAASSIESNSVRQRAYARRGTEKIVSIILNHLLAHPRRSVLAENHNLCMKYIMKLANYCVRHVEGAFNFSDAIPFELARMKEFNGCAVEALVPIHLAKNDITGGLKDGKFEGYEIHITKLPKKCLVHFEELPNIWLRRHVITSTITEILKNPKYTRPWEVAWLAPWNRRGGIKETDPDYSDLNDTFRE